jgi:hypothetical protein
MSPARLEFATAVRIGPAKIGIRTNHAAHVPHFPGDIEVKSLLTDFHSIEVIPYSENLDGHIHIREAEGPPRIQCRDNLIECQGPFLSLAERSADARRSFWGNLGLLYHFTLHLLETRHGMLSLHACALFETETRTLFIAAGGAGSGKTVYLLSGLARGLSLFSTETVHVQIQEDDVLWRMGSLVDNIRWGTLLHDFPHFQPDRPAPPPGNVWQEKIALDLSGHRCGQTSLRSPNCVLLFPRIEQGRSEFLMTPIQDPDRAAQLMFGNIAEKTSQSFVLYGSVAVPGFDTGKSAQMRLDALRRLTRHPSLGLVASVLTDPEHCWGNLLATNPSQGD